MDIAAGYMHSVAIGNDCSLYTWGADAGGTLGLGLVIQQNRPMRVANVGSLCGTPVIYTQGATDFLPDGSTRLRFSSDLNRLYYIEYSSDLLNWKTILPGVIGNGGVVEWVDSGPPQTESHPRAVANRYYRVMFGH